MEDTRQGGSLTMTSPAGASKYLSPSSSSAHSRLACPSKAKELYHTINMIGITRKTTKRLTRLQLRKKPIAVSEEVDAAVGHHCVDATPL
jgi:hypothetical protein